MNKRLHDKPSKPFMTEYGLYGDCRNCPHAHVEMLSCKIEIANLQGTAFGPVARCACKDWAPVDNLDFLEWQFKRKEKASGTF